MKSSQVAYNGNLEGREGQGWLAAGSVGGGCDHFSSPTQLIVAAMVPGLVLFKAWQIYCKKRTKTRIFSANKEQLDNFS